MGVLSLKFLALTLLAGLAYRLLPRQRERAVALTLANGAFLWSFAERLQDLLPLLAFAFAGYVAIALLRKHASPTRLAACVVSTIVLFVVLKQYVFVKPLLSFDKPLLTVGLSYVLFRVLHLMIDVGTGGAVEGFTPLAFLSYVFNFLTFLSGPIQRFEDHCRELQAGPNRVLDGPLLGEVGTRASTGLIKLVFLAPAVLQVQSAAVEALHGKASALSHLPASLELAAAALAYLMFLYWNFSGYMDLVIAAGRFMGFSVPENFTNPFSAPNFIELWSRWHITLSDWFRFYLFNPTVAALTRLRTDVKLAPYYGAVGFLVTFFVMGVWHGTTGIFVFYGLLLGAGVSVNKLYQVQLRAWLGKLGTRKLSESFAYERLCNGLCIAFFAFALCCFWLEWRGLGELLRHVRASGLLLAFFASVGAIVALRLVYDAGHWLVVRPSATRFFGSPWTRQAWTSLVLLMVLIHAALTNSDLPPFVYAEF